MRLKIDDISQLNGQHFFIQCDLRMCIWGLMATESQWNIFFSKYILYHIIPVLRTLQWLLFDLGIGLKMASKAQYLTYPSSSHSLFSIYMSFPLLPLKQINLTAASGPVHLLFQFFKWLTLSHHPGLNPNVTSWEMPSTQPPSLYSILVLYFYWNITNGNYHLFAYHLSSTHIPLEFKFHEIEDLICLVQNFISSTWQIKSIYGTDVTNKH